MGASWLTLLAYWVIGVWNIGAIAFLGPLDYWGYRIAGATGEFVYLSLEALRVASRLPPQRFIAPSGSDFSFCGNQAHQARHVMEKGTNTIML